MENPFLNPLLAHRHQTLCGSSYDCVWEPTRGEDRIVTLVGLVYGPSPRPWNVLLVPIVDRETMTLEVKIESVN